VADENDDLLDPSEIEALLNAGGGSPASEGAGADPNPSPDDAAGGDMLDASEIEALMNGGGATPAPEEPPDTLGASEIEALLQQQSTAPAATGAAGRTEQLLDQAEADLAAAVAPNIGSNEAEGSARPFEFQSFEPGSEKSADVVALKALQDVELDLRIELGRTELLIEDVLKLKTGSIVPLDKLAGDPVDIIVNGHLIARGEVLVLNDNFCVRVAEILTPEG
jgi:flagellar motor switch protein FliN/FliY